MCPVPELVSILEWDSEFFGFPVAQVQRARLSSIEMDMVLVFCKRHKVKLLQFKCDSHDRESIRLAEANKFQFADTRIVLDRKIDGDLRVPELGTEFSFRVASAGDVKILQEIARDLYVDSRYYFDTNFDRERVQVLYSDWIRKAVFGEFDDIAWVLCKDHIPAAFCSANFGETEARIGLVGLKSELSGYGLGKSIIQYALTQLYAAGSRSVTVVTQGRNYRAQRLYQRSGFMISQAQIYYHCWFDRD